ncbi:Calmodulin [Hexamita inflata]|uniref:Calmodulin n=1 Tax=Hexamita inflata TaxID=28002 RepID=A0AA86QIF1_9EUKA|nr:Calmodulin [Hexamita inflata]
MGCSTLNVTENSQNQITKQEIRRIFQTFDQKCSGQLTCDELNQLLLQENIGDIPPELLKTIIQIADYNDDNIIQLKEFSKLITILLSSYTIEELIMKFITKNGKLDQKSFDKLKNNLDIESFSIEDNRLIDLITANINV